MREDIIKTFKRGIFPYIDGFQAEKESHKVSDEKSDKNDETDTTDTTDSESEEFTVQRENQQGQGLTILTPNQMLSRLPICLAQLKAENNSEKIQKEIRQLLYSLYRSKKLTKQLYNNLISAI